MNVVIRIAAIAATPVMALGIASAASVPAARAAAVPSRPVVYNGMHGWRFNRLPGTIVLHTYSGHSTYRITRIHWKFNNRGGAHNNWEARGTGRLMGHRGDLYATNVRWHHGVRYYSILDLYAGGTDYSAAWGKGRWITN